MAFDTYANLKTAIADWLNRTDLTTAIPDFISLAEAEMKRRLRRYSTRATLTIDAESVSLPTDCAELRAIVLETGSVTSDVPLRLGTLEMHAERKARAGGATGRPDTCAILGSTLLVAPTPDTSYTARIVYSTQLTALSNTNSSNSILADAPDAYLFGALWQAELYLEHPDAAESWKQKFIAAIDQLNEQRDREESTASIRDVRIRTFG